jgi:RNA polymerase sigma-70 factor (sigma-E family)
MGADGIYCGDGKAAPPSGGEMSSARDDEQGFRRFAVEFTPTLLRGAYFLLRDLQLAEDVVQVTMLRTSQHWRRARRAPEAYSRQVLINACREHWRRQTRRPREVSLSDQEPVERTVSFTDQVQQRQALDHALSGLVSPQREVLVLRFFFDLSVAQTAEALAIAEGTVKSATHRGLGQLREILTKAEEGSYVQR